MTLNDFLAMAERRRFEPGTWDCCLMVADWVRECTGIDGAAPWRGRYRTVRGYLRHLRDGGGVQCVVARGAALAGLVETTQPGAGDVGVVMGDNGPTGAICTGPRWVATGAHGLAGFRAEPLRAWTVRLRPKLAKPPVSQGLREAVSRQW